MRQDTQLKMKLGRCMAVGQLDPGGGGKEEAAVVGVAILHVGGGNGKTQQLAVLTLTCVNQNF